MSCREIFFVRERAGDTEPRRDVGMLFCTSYTYLPASTLFISNVILTVKFCINKHLCLFHYNFGWHYHRYQTVCYSKHSRRFCDSRISKQTLYMNINFTNLEKSKCKYFKLALMSHLCYKRSKIKFQLN